MGNMKSSYIQYEVRDNQFCVWSVSGLNPVTSDFYVSCCYYENTYEIGAQLEIYIREVVAAGHVLNYSMHIINNFYLLSFFVTMIFFV